MKELYTTKKIKYNLKSLEKDTEYFMNILDNLNFDKLVDSKDMPYIKKSKKLKTPETFEECKKFILDKSMYMYWSRCEYECIVHCWPVKKNEYKLDVYEQIEMNIDVITKHFMNQITNK